MYLWRTRGPANKESIHQKGLADALKMEGVGVHSSLILLFLDCGAWGPSDGAGFLSTPPPARSPSLERTDYRGYLLPDIHSFTHYLERK